jgi:ankyrin repeat protein
MLTLRVPSKDIGASRDHIGNTVLHVAAACGQLETCKLLLTTPALRARRQEDGSAMPAVPVPSRDWLLEAKDHAGMLA